MTTRARRVLLGIGIALPIVAASLGWYWFRHSMAPAASFDVTGLGSIDEREWDAIIVLHTWELQQPQPDAAAFIARTKNTRKLIVLSTSGAGTQKIEGIDAISAASKMTDVPSRVAELVARIDPQLAH